MIWKDACACSSDLLERHLLNLAATPSHSSVCCAARDAVLVPILVLLAVMGLLPEPGLRSHFVMRGIITCAKVRT
jgi:hypothetical protein